MLGRSVLLEIFLSLVFTELIHRIQRSLIFVRHHGPSTARRFAQKKHETMSGMSSADETDATLEFSAMQDEVTPSFIYRHLLHKDANFKKLKTREDPYHIHKTLGILSLCSFFYRYGVQYPATGNLVFSGDWLYWLTIHTAPITSFPSVDICETP